MSIAKKLDGAAPDMADTHPLLRDAGSTARADQQPAPRHSGPIPPNASGQAGCEALRWFVVRHRPYEGDTARDAIQSLGFQAHHFVERFRRPKRDDVMRAYFPGYLFARWSMSNPRWGDICRLPTVVGVISSPFGQPMVVRDSDMRVVLQREDGSPRFVGDILVPDAKPAKASPIGQMFTVQVGPWARFMGECTGVDPKGRVQLMMTLFGRSSVQDFDLAKLAAV